MINVTGFRYCRLGTANLEETVKFATDIIGLEEVGRENGSVYMRGDRGSMAQVMREVMRRHLCLKK